MVKTIKKNYKTYKNTYQDDFFFKKNTLIITLEKYISQTHKRKSSPLTIIELVLYLKRKIDINFYNSQMEKFYCA